MVFEPLARRGADLEAEVLEVWRQENLFGRTVEATADGEPFVFYEGPPTANGRPGIHHVCLSVGDLDAVLERLRAAGVRLAGETRIGAGGRRVAFVHPKSAHGVLLELSETG